VQIGLVVLLLLGTVVVYAPALRGGFVWDDDVYVTQNASLRSAEGLGRIWFDLGATPQYYPLVFTTFWVEYHLWGANDAFGFHVVNVLLHALGALLLWRVLRRLSLPGAWLAAAIFAFHPVHVESVAWITERKNVLSGVWYFAALLAYGRFAGWSTEPTDGSRRWRFYILALVFFLFALFSKTVTCSLPAVIVLLLWWKRSRLRWGEVVPLVPMFALGLAMGLLTAWMERHTVGAQGPGWDLSPIQRFLLAGRAIWFYLAKLAWPTSLTFVYPKWSLDARDWIQYLAPVSVLLALGVMWTLRWRIGKTPLLVALFFGGTLFPALGFIDTYPMRYYYVADHFQYLASVGPIAVLAAIVTTALPRIRSRHPRGGPRRDSRSSRSRDRRDPPESRSSRTVAATIRQPLICGALLCVYGALTWHQASSYKDLEILYRDTLARNPEAVMAHNNLGQFLGNKGDHTEALEHLKEAVRIDPDFTEAQYNLGTSLSMLGRTDEAIRAYREAIRIEPDHQQAHNNLGNAYLQRGDTAQAVEQYRIVLGVNPRHVDAHANLGVALGRLGRVEEAVAEYRKAIAINARHVAAHYNLANLLAGLGRIDEAIAEYRHVIRLAPTLSSAYTGLGNALMVNQQVAQAKAAYREALRLNPNDITARRALDSIP
jgi:tetratricopeptide (TPR) repeat protein